MKKDRKKTNVEEVRVQVCVSYSGLKDDEKMLDEVKVVNNFEPVEQQQYGAFAIPTGFIIFQGDRYPSEDDKEKMKAEVLRAAKTFRNNWTGF